MRILFALMMLTVTTLFADDGGNTNMNYSVLRSRTTQSGFTVEQIEFPNTAPNNNCCATLQIWLVEPNNPTKRKLLFTTERNAEVVFSENAKWLFINNNDSLERERILLYRQKNGLDYEFVGDLTDDAWDFFAKKSGHPQPSDHYYVEVVCWTDENTVLLRLLGNGGIELESWLCLYDVSSKKFSTDLDQHNKKQDGILRYHMLGR
jgi:hypothetical protein